MSRGLSCRVRVRPGFPRVSGDEPLEQLVGHFVHLFSPRERG